MQPPHGRVIRDPQAEMERLAAERKLTPRTRQFLDEALTAVKPGETLILRIATTACWTPDQVRDYQDALDTVIRHRGLTFKVLVVTGDEMGTAAS